MQQLTVPAPTHHPVPETPNWLQVFILVIAAVTLLQFSKAHARGAQLYTLNVSAYSSSSNQTDSTPFITAADTRVRPGVLAVSQNLLGRQDLPYGTRVLAVSQHGCGLPVTGRVFTVEDTMNRRYTHHADIWLSSRSSAMQFGRCIVTFRKL